MAQPRPPGRSAQGPAQRSHHISAIAHHFFDVPAKVASESSTVISEVTVACAGPGPLAAWICAGLTPTLGSREVVLAESPWLMWSAASYLEDSRLELLDNSDALMPGSGNNLRFWRASPGDQRVLLRNLGHLTSRQLVELEAIRSAEHPAGLILPGGGALVWCLTTPQAHSLISAYTLGRVLALFKPVHLEIVVCDLNLRNLGPLPAGGEPLSLDLCMRLVDSVAFDCPVHLSEVPARSASGVLGPSEIFETIGRRFLYSD